MVALHYERYDEAKKFLERAKEILKDTEEDGIVTYKSVENTDMQMPLEMQNASEILKELKNIDVNTLTPIESMQILFEICFVRRLVPVKKGMIEKRNHSIFIFCTKVGE